MKTHRPKKNGKLIQACIDKVGPNDTIESVSNQLLFAKNQVELQERTKPGAFTEILAIFHQPTFYTIFSILMLYWFKNICGLWILIPVTIINALIFSRGNVYYEWEKVYVTFTGLEDIYSAMKEKLEANQAEKQ